MMRDISTLQRFSAELELRLVHHLATSPGALEGFGLPLGVFGDHRLQLAVMICTPVRGYTYKS
jgi:hypothetical protein